MEKIRQLEFFMTIEDEKLFCKKVREFNPNMAFLSTIPSKESDINARLFESIENSSGFTFSIVNLDIVCKEELSKRYEMHGGFYHFAQVARGQMQLLRSHNGISEPQHLQAGRIADSYETEDEEDKKWKNKIYSILRKLGSKVHWYYMNLEGKPEIKIKAESGIVALPNAVKNYNGKNGCFMRQNRAKFVSEDITIEDLKTTDS